MSGGLVKFTFGTYECGGKTLERDYWLNPDAIAGVRAETAGRTSSIVMLRGADNLLITMRPENVARIITSAITSPIDARIEGEER